MDELTSVTPPPASGTPPDSGQATQTSQPTSPTPQPQSGSESAAPTAPKQRVNLFELDEFKAYQAQQNRTLSQYQQQLAEYQRVADEARMASMDDLERAEYRAQMAEARAQQYEEMIQQQQAVQQYEQARLTKLQELSTKTNIPLDTLAQARTPLELADILADYHKQQVETLANSRAAELKARQEANRPDLGGGSLASFPDDAMREAWQNRDATAYIRALRQSATQ